VYIDRYLYCTDHGKDGASSISDVNHCVVVQVLLESILNTLVVFIHRWEIETGGSGRDLIEVLSRNLPGGIEETTKDLSQDIRGPVRDSNGTPPEYESKALPPSVCSRNRVIK
jgi:hypothetical protein